MLGGYRDELDVRFVLKDLCLLKLLKVTERRQCSVMGGGLSCSLDSVWERYYQEI